MRKINFTAGLILFVFIAAGCHTLSMNEVSAPEVKQGVEGVYLAKTSTPNGEIEFTMAIKADGCGYLESRMGKAEFADAKIEGKKFAFNLTMSTQMGEMALTFEGAVDGDNIDGTIGTQMGSLPFTGQRKL